MYTSTISDQTDRGTLACYDGADSLVGIPPRNDIVAEFDNGMTAILQQSLSGKQPIYFMPTEVSDDIEGYSSYILRIAGTLINGQKPLRAVIDIDALQEDMEVTGVKAQEVFFRICLSFIRALYRILDCSWEDILNGLVIATSSDPSKCSYHIYTHWLFLLIIMNSKHLLN